KTPVTTSARTYTTLWDTIFRELRRVSELSREQAFWWQQAVQVLEFLGEGRVFVGFDRFDFPHHITDKGYETAVGRAWIDGYTILDCWKMESKFLADHIAPNPHEPDKQPVTGGVSGGALVALAWIKLNVFGDLLVGNREPFHDSVKQIKEQKQSPISA
ncbi:MAG: hypothetical protein ABI832_24445, partial [bacterium]